MPKYELFVSRQLPLQRLNKLITFFFFYEIYFADLFLYVSLKLLSLEQRNAPHPWIITSFDYDQANDAEIHDNVSKCTDFRKSSLKYVSSRSTKKSGINYKCY